MVGKRVPGAEGGAAPGKRRGRRAGGLKIVERDGIFHVHGNVVSRRGTVRVRKSLRLPASEANLRAAWDEARAIEQEILGELSGERRPGDYVAVAAERYLTRSRTRPLGASTVRIIQDVVAEFGLRRLNEIRTKEWKEAVDRRQAGNRSETRERYITGIVAFLAWAKAHAGLADLPNFDRDTRARNPNRRARRRVQELRPELIGRLLAAAHITVRAQLAVEWSTGGRVSSVLHGCRVCDLILAPARSQIAFHDTKNGTSVQAALHPVVEPILAEYLEWRGDLHDREAPLFLTWRRQPYADTGQAWGGQNKTAFRAARRRAVAGLRKDGAARVQALRRAGDRAGAEAALHATKADAALLGRVTQHWFRHLMATKLLQISDIKTVMEQGGWLDARSVMGYAHDVPDHRRRALEQIESFDTFMTRDDAASAKKQIKSMHKAK